MGKKRICLDPGHAGPNYNAGVVPGYFESERVFKLTMYEKEYLEAMGIEVVLTRTDINDNPDLVARGKMAEGCDLIVSNHSNACGTPSVTRAVCIYLTENAGTDIDDISRDFASKLAQTIDASMGNIGHQTYSKLSERDRDGDGLKNDNYYAVLHGAFLAGVPGVIAEHGFHTNEGICNWLLDDNNLRKLAQDCAKCMAAHVGVYEPTAEDDCVFIASDFKGFTREEVLAQIGHLLTEHHKRSGILAAVRGAQLILESGGLQTELAQNANNCHGMKACLSNNTWAGSVWNGEIYTKKTSEWDGEKYIEVIADFRKYPDIETSMLDHIAYLTNAMNGSKRRYEGLVGCKDHEKAIRIIKNGGYATSPDYVQKLLNVIDKYDLKRFDYSPEHDEELPEKPEEVVVDTKPEADILRPPFTVKVLIDDLNYRSEPSMKGTILGQTGKGVFTITEFENGWGKLKSGVGWIWLWNANYCTINKTPVKEEPAMPKVPFKVKVNILDLKIRTGAGTIYADTGNKTGIGTFTIVEVKEGPGSNSGWGRLKSGAGWISLDYTERL